MFNRFLRGWLVLFMLLASLLPAQPVLAQSAPATTVFEDHAGDDRSRIDVILHTDSAPGPGGVATLTLTATPALDVPDLLFEWLVPPGVELLGGSASELASNSTRQAVARVRQVRFPNPGVYKVMGRASYGIEPALHFSALGVLFFTVNRDGTSTVSDKDPDARSPMGTIMPTEVIQDVNAAATRSPTGDPCFNVSGRVMRTDLPPTQNGAANPNPMYGVPVQVPVRYAQVVMREEDTLFDDSYGSMATDANGYYAFSFCDDDGIFDDELELYVRLHSEIDFNGSDVVTVEDDGVIDDMYEFDSNVIESEGGTYTINFNLDMNQSAIMNVADAVFEAWKVWNDSGGAKGDDAIFDGEAEVHYEPGDGVGNSFYNGYFLTGSNVLNNDDISIADDPSDPDPWDDSVIMHEWGHFADDYYGCDDNGGGPHNLDTLAGDLELSWGEGYPDYYQSAVRSLTGHNDASWYLDVDGSGSNGIAVDLETYDNTRVNGFGRPDLLSDFNEMAIAAQLWDLYDNNNDPRTPGAVSPASPGPWDRVANGHAPIQEVYTDPFFESNGDWFDDTCTNFVYLWSWLSLGKPTDAGTAEVITKNVGRVNPFGNGTLAAASVAGSTDLVTAATHTATANNNPNNIDPRWWKRLTMLVDNSASMAVAGKLEAVKTVMNETINDVVAPDPKGVEVRIQTFNNTTYQTQPVLEGQFFPEGITPIISGLSPVGAADPSCQVNALGSLQQAINGQQRGQVWLYTDGDTYLQPSLPLIRRQFNEQQMRASIALLGGCTPVARAVSDVSGAEEDYLQLAADNSQSSGITPYLLTALGTGGQFLYVNQDQLGDAADILRAQLANSAGAGKWSDYVSDSFTYRWDRLTEREYQWFPAESLGQGQGQIPTSGFLTYNLPEPFSFFGDAYTSVGISQDGYIRLNPCSGQFCIQGFNNLYVLNADLVWNYKPFPPRAAAANAVTETVAAASQPAAAPDSSTATAASCASFITGYGPQVRAFSANLGFEWHIISTQGCASDGVYRAYQVWLNTKTGEIRYQYDRVRNEAATAKIGLEQFIGFISGGTEVIVSNNDVAGARNGTGYKFTPAPPQPSKTFTVAVDSLVQSVGFLQTGYSGTFEPMIVTDPAGSPVNCADTVNVLCLTVDHVAGDRMVQYVQVNTNGNTGKWHAVIDAGAGGQGTFSFNALAASDLNADSPSQRLLASVGTSPLRVNLGRATDNGTLTGWFQSPNGNRFGSEFTLYDDGTHDDGRAGDGRFGLPDLTAPGRGVGYLWVQGITGGVDFHRADPVPFNFQPLRVTILDEVPANNTETFDLSVQVDNLSNSDICVDPDVMLPDGWGYDWDYDLLGCLGIAGNSSVGQVLTVYPNWPTAPSGQQGEVTVAFAESEEGAISATDSTTITRRRPPVTIDFDERIEQLDIRPDNTLLIPMSVLVTDPQGYPVADGTPVEVSVTGGSIAQPSVTAASAASPNLIVGTINGRVQLAFTPPTSEADVVATATTAGLTATANLTIRNPAPDAIALVASQTELLREGATATLVATVRDQWGNPSVGVNVRIGVSDDDGSKGTIDGSEIVTTVTDEQGQVPVTFTKAAGATGIVYVRAELLGDEASGFKAMQEDEVQLLLDASGAQANRLYLPLVTR